MLAPQPLDPTAELRPAPVRDDPDAQDLPLWRRVLEVPLVRRLAILAVLASLWQAYAMFKGNALILPSFLDVADAFFTALGDGRIPAAVATSLQVLVIGYALGVAAALVLTTLAITTRLGRDLLATLTAMFNPLPAVALLPLAFLWFGLGQPSLIFVIIHSVLWPVALSTLTGFTTVGETMRMAAVNVDLRGPRLVVLVLIPAAFPQILSGLRIGWAFAWRTLIAAELVFGVTSSSGGLGWFIFENRNRLETDLVFAGLVTVILIGLVVDAILFRLIERATVQKWGMQR
ncbi:ABC transporter permease [Telmatospirillum sp. J64-1]|uniref:ABC transporter permease n=1 Tax=Telmatospirillum sp. J64-1 TaxID=2502183 RepID=UPI00115E5746|nr:ABC transporter permease [Telmatospirillum sp. J64-1]